VGHDEDFRRLYQYTESSVESPVRVGFAHGGCCRSFFRAYLSDSFDQAGVDVRLRTSFADDPYRFELVTRNFEREHERRGYEGMGAVSGRVLDEMIVAGELDGALVSESDLLLDYHEGLPLVVVARMGHTEADRPGLMLVTRSGFEPQSVEDLHGKTLSTRQDSPSDRIFLQELLSQHGMEEGVDYQMLEGIPDEEQFKWLAKGSFDAGLYRTCGATKLIKEGKAELFKPMDWIEPELASAYLVFHRDFVESRPDDVRRLLRGLAWRLDYESRIPSGERLERRDFNYIIDFPFMGSRLPHTTFPFEAKASQLEPAQALLVKHGLLEGPRDLRPLVRSAPFVRPLVAERPEGPWLPPAAESTPTAIDQAELEALAAFTEVSLASMESRSKGLPIFDALLGVDRSVASGMLSRKLQEADVAMGLLHWVALEGDVSDRSGPVRVAYPERFLATSNARGLPEQALDRRAVGPVDLRLARRSWPGFVNQSQTQAEVNAAAQAAARLGVPLLLRQEGLTSYEDGLLLRQVLGDHPSLTVVLILSSLVSPEELQPFLQRHVGLHVVLSGLERRLDLDMAERSYPTSIYRTRVVKGIGSPVIGFQSEWSTLFKEYPDRFMFGSSGFTSFYYETRYKAEVKRYRRSIRKLPRGLGEAMAWRNAARLFGTAP